jgi:hypothetical protein
MEEFVCKVCGKKFGSQQALNQHYQAKHAKEKVERKIPRKKILYTFLGIVLLLLLAYPIYWAFTSPLKIGPLGSQKIYADFAVFINGEQYNFNNSWFVERSPYIYIRAPYYSLLHMDATNVPLKIFFKSINWDISRDCIKLHTDEIYCTNETHTLKFYVNGERIEDISNYAFSDLDKVLISYGDESEEEIEKQMEKISDYAWQASAGLI